MKVIQHAIHKQMGTITHEHRNLWTLHYALAAGGYRQLCGLHELLLRREVTPNHDRMLSADDPHDLVPPIYYSGTQMVINVMLTMQHFCHYLELAAENCEGEGEDVRRRMDSSFKRLGLTLDETQPGYQALMRMHKVRDAVEHPKQGNVFSAHPTDWDRVPLNWFLTEQPIKMFHEWDQWLGERLEEVRQYFAIRGPVVQTLTVVRGVRSDHQFKKPPQQERRE